MIVRFTVLLLCAVGLYASAFMLRKSLRAARGELEEPSVVQTARARALGGTPNAGVGLAYYGCLAVATLLFSWPPAWWAGFLASLGAAAFSAYLAYSLLFVTRMPCVYCWTSHVVNWSLPVLIFFARGTAG
jgi:uncharacterized membrane protein